MTIASAESAAPYKSALPNPPGRGLSVVIPTYNGFHLLQESLDSVIAGVNGYREETGAEAEIIVVDDGSEDGTAERLPDAFPGVRVKRRSVNGGFARACNSGFAEARFPLVALLNNDVRVHRDYFIFHALHFSDPRVFAVTAKVFEWDRPIFTTGGRYASFRRGFWSVYYNYDRLPGKGQSWVESRRLLSFYAIGGFATFDREKLLELGGFLELLSPFHWEDVDLSYRGWKRGWEIRYEPRSLAYHRTSATINRFYRSRYVESVSFRNRLLFHWINLHNRLYLTEHLFWLALLFLSRFAALDFGFYRSLFGALRRLPEALRLRKAEKSSARRSDGEVAGILKNFYRLAPIEVYLSKRDVMKRHSESGLGRAANQSIRS